MVISMDKGEPHPWQFASRFRRGAFGWKSQPAIRRIREAVSEIRKVARENPVLGAEGAVLFLERVSPALEQVDGSSGAVGRAVRISIEQLVPVISVAEVDARVRGSWLERLFAAHARDEIPYIETLTDHWGDLCATTEMADQWADRLLEITRSAIGPNVAQRGHYHGATACLSALCKAGRNNEILGLVRPNSLWRYQRWVIRALVANGKKAEAIRQAERCRSPWASDKAIDRVCEGILLSSGMADEAYRRYGLRANRTGTHLSWYRAVARRYPNKSSREILRDLVAVTPGEEGKWFAAAKDAGLLEEALELANRTPCAPQTLMRASRDFVNKQPGFALECGVAAIRWLAAGYGYDIHEFDVEAAYTFTMDAACRLKAEEETEQRLREFFDADSGCDSFVAATLGRCLDARTRS